MMTDRQQALVSLLLGSFPNFQTGDAESALTAYEIAIADFDDADLLQGVTAFIQGRVPGHNMAFAPTAPQLASACRRAMEARLDTVNRRRSALKQIADRTADVGKTDDSRARVRAKVEALIQNLSAGSEFNPANSAMLERARARHDSYFSVGDPEGNTDAGEVA